MRVVERLHAEDVLAVDARKVGPYRHAARRDERLVEPEPQGAVLLDGSHLDLTGVEVDRSDLVAHADVDAEAITEFLRPAGHQLVEGAHFATDEIGDATRGVGGVVPALEGDDLHVGTRLAHLRHGGHAARVAPDDHEPLGHRARG